MTKTEFKEKFEEWYREFGSYYDANKVELWKLWKNTAHYRGGDLLSTCKVFTE